MRGSLIRSAKSNVENPNLGVINYLKIRGNLVLDSTSKMLDSVRAIC